MGHVTLSIVIGTYNRLPLLRRCLEAITNGVYVAHEIFVIDGGSNDGTLEYLKQHAGIRFISDESLIGQAKSINQVIGSINGDFFCWLSDDNVVMDGMLDTAVDILSADKQIGMVSLKVRDVTGPHTHVPYLGAIWASGVLNCNQGMLPTALLRQLGGFNEEFRDYGIDADLTTRVLLAGYKVVYTKAVVIHHYRDHDTDSWITKTNRGNRLQLARDLYRNRYDKLVLGKSDLSTRNSRISSLTILALGSGFTLYLYEKMMKTLRVLLEFLMNNAMFGLGVSSFFKDCYNVLYGRFISAWDLVENFYRSYYLVQKIPDSLRSQFQIKENST